MKRYLLTFGMVITALFAGKLYSLLSVSALAGGGGGASQNGDVNGDGRLDISDAVYTLSFLFQGGQAPVACAQGGVSPSSLSAPDGDPIEALVVSNEGNVGIGTPAPGFPVHIKTSTLHSNAWVGVENDVQQWLIGVRGDDFDRFEIIDNTGGTDPRLAIDTLGNVGIGTNAPSFPVHIKTSPNTWVAVENDVQQWLVGVRGDEFDSFQIVDNTGGTDQRLVIDTLGNVGIGTPTPQAKLDVAGDLRVSGRVTSQLLELTSDREVKSGFEKIDAGEVLRQVARLRISKWHFKDAPGVPHIGPMAQDFHASFGVGSDDKHIATVDADGVAFAAIQGLYALLEEKETRIAVLEKELAAQGGLAARISALEQAVQQSSSIDR